MASQILPFMYQNAQRNMPVTLKGQTVVTDKLLVTNEPSPFYSYEDGKRTDEVAGIKFMAVAYDDEEHKSNFYDVRVDDPNFAVDRWDLVTLSDPYCKGYKGSYYYHTNVANSVGHVTFEEGK
ncbi:hypothetical protein ACLUW2_09650 [Limosilactobacillus balticus]|uniref:hypothetical protein n=1 Tax=Limosilactobacillus balticus TaxID=2759747 RepID=UPI0039957D6D